MAEISRLKSEILREAVRENVDLIEGRRPQRPRVKGRRRWLGVAAAVVLPVALFLSINAISLGREKSDVVVVGRAPSRAEAPAAVSMPAPHGMEPSLFRLAVTSIVIDPGHGGADPGARTASGLTEKEITLDVARRLKSLLEEAHFTAFLTREKDETLSLKDRVLFANAKRADLLVSIHVNSIPVKDRRVVETYYLGPTSDSHAERLAGDENRGSGYSLADFRKLFEGVYAGVRQTESRRFAEAVQGGLVSALKPSGGRIDDRGVKSAPFVVLIAAEMPGVLAEVSCVSDDEEARRLADPAYRQRIAMALLGGVAAYAEERNHPPTKEGEMTGVKSDAGARRAAGSEPQ
jgi:N-acetylmuramoyl-L-alanine amidase